MTLLRKRKIGVQGILFFIVITMMSFETFAQKIIPVNDQLDGPDIVNLGQQYEYYYTSEVLYFSYNWYVSNGYVQSHYQSANTYYATLVFNSLGTSTIHFEDGNGAIVASKTVTVLQACSTPPTPLVTFSVSSSTCSPRIVSYTGTMPSDVTWFWQTAPSGTSVSNPGNTQTITSNTTLYIRARSNASLCWSNASSGYTVTVSAPPATPTAPTVSTNTCGAKTITRGTPPTGVTWYWQGTNSSGQDISNSATTYTANVSGTYYLRARNNSTLCWSTSRSVSVTITPSQPTATMSSNTCGPVTLTRGTPSGTDVWYWQGTTALGTSTTNSALTYSVTSSGTYYIRSRNSSGCWSPTSTAFVITVNAKPGTPPMPTASSNTCGARILSKSAAPAGITYYWQGMDVGGTDYTSPGATAATYTATQTGCYYLNSRNNTTGCWGNSAQICLVVDIPAKPADATFTFCEWETMTLTTTGYPLNGTLRWSEPSYTGYPFGTSLTVSKPAGTYTYQVRSASSQYCESADYATVILTVLENCDHKINWGETIGYTLDENGNSVPYTSSRTYSDGHGHTLQSQSKDYVNNKVLASQPVYDRNNQPVVGTLPAPITATDFAYKAKFVTNSSNLKYSKNDFDLPGTVPGSRDNPKPVGQSEPGTLGWYYSSNNTLEPLTPTTTYPYSRTWSEESPDPKESRSAIPGNAFRMGNGKEVESKREKAAIAELQHYLAIGSHFGSGTAAHHTPLWELQASSANKSKFTPKETTIVTEIAPDLLLFASSQTNGMPGTYPIDGTITVVPGKTYTYWIKGYRGNANQANLYVTTASGTNIVWPGPALPQGNSNMDWVSVNFTVPAGITGIKLGVAWSQPAASSTMVLNYAKLTTLNPVAEAGYKYISTDPNEKQAVSFVDFDGKTLATATKTGGVYDNWSYVYYNTTGQVVATVAPNGVNTASTAYPSFVTLYKYDHLGRLIETTDPDEGTSQFVYSLEGDIRFSQNQEQRNATPKRFSYTNYDYLGRLIEGGEYTMSGSDYFVFEPHSTQVPNTYSVLNLVDNTGFTGVTRRGNNATLTRYSDTTFIEYDAQALDFITDTHHPSQTNTFGQVTKTKNGNAFTWYSYDEFGQLTWTKQSIYGLGIKTVDYDYDFLGNVTQVTYQKGQPDAFYHHYVYDANQRLSEVWTSLNGTSKTLKARYHYYLHGPLKRVELGNNVQGIDYVYTINGSLKSINDAAQANDPGEDGANSFAADVFGQTIHYYANDYTGAGHTASTQSFSGYADQYGGALKGVSWHTPVDNNMQPRTYAFAYDNKYQLQESKFGNFSAGAFVASPLDEYKESIPGYDKNGNIQSLQRKGLNGTTLGNYNYVYEPNTNKLDKVNHNSSLLVDYTYNAIGQMTRQQEGNDVMNVAYNAYGLTKNVRNATSQLMVEYAYDDRGDLVKRTDYTGGTAAKHTFYVRDASGNPLAVYEQVLPSDTPQLIEMPVYGAGRVAVYRPQLNAYFYEIGDHLGNVRAVIGTTDTDIYTATMETENLASEEPPFKNIAATSAVFLAANHTPGGNEAARLNYQKPAGPALSLAVSAGDKLDIKTWASYEAGSDYQNAINSNVMIYAIASAFGGISGAAGEAGQIYSSLSNALGTGSGMLGLGGTDDEELPGAYICYLIFDINRNFTGQGGYYRVTEAGNQAQELITIPQVTVEQPGYAYIFVYNRSGGNHFVYFDDMEVKHEHSPIVAGSDYFPFGLPMEGREITQEAYRWGYQGQHSEKDSVTGWNQFQLRMYDARFGRWLSPDPYGQFASPYVGMGNMPNMGTDPDGGFFIDPDPIVFFTQLPELVVTSSGKSYMALMSASALLNAGSNAMTRFEIDGSATYWSYANVWTNYDPNSGDIQAYNNGVWEYQGNTYSMQDAHARNMMQFSSDAQQFIADASLMAVPTGPIVGAAMKPLLNVGGKVMARVVSKVLPRVAAKGVSVIGPRATYRETAKKIGANFLDVTDEAWTMRKNVEFLQGVVKRGDDVIFSGKFNPAKLDPNSVLGQEIRYLQRHGYSWTDDFSKMIKK